jgi:hypothetical protein
VKTQDVLPALLSIIVIILVAIMEKQSKLFAALMATMHLAAPPALRIVYSSKPFIRPAANFRLPNYGLAGCRAHETGADDPDGLWRLGHWSDNIIFFTESIRNKMRQQRS